MFSSFLLNCNLNTVGTVKENLSPQGLGGKRNFKSPIVRSNHTKLLSESLYECKAFMEEKL